MACHTNNCKTRMHYHCFTTFRRRHNTCPSCRAEWPETAEAKPLVPVGENASKGDDDVRRSGRVRSAEDSDESEADEMIEEEEPGGSQTQPTQQRSQRARKGKATASQDMDIDGSQDFEPAVKKGKKSTSSSQVRRSSRK